MGKIIIEEMEFYAFHGHYQEEQIVGNRFLVDLELDCDMARASETDDLDDAVNYQLAYQLIRKEMRRKKSNLLENIAKRILDSLYENMEGIREAQVRVRKMHPPMGGPIKSVGVTMRRKNG